MREIKFRAWDGVDRKLRGPFTMAEIQSEGAWLSEPGTVLMQFTGLHDRNGVEIYEGDILGTPDLAPSVVVEFGDTYELMDGNGYYGWYCRYPGKMRACQLNESVKYTSEVIGNRWENPELLEVKL
jgi:uncharacterized phage protein (TIGR01671 family)